MSYNFLLDFNCLSYDILNQLSYSFPMILKLDRPTVLYLALYLLSYIRHLPVLRSMKRMSPILIIWPKHLKLVSLVVVIADMDSHGTLSMLVWGAYLSVETWKKRNILNSLVSAHIECKNRDIVTYNFFLSDSCLSMWGGESYRIHDMKYQHSFNIFELEISTFIAFEENVAKKKFLTISRFSEVTNFLLLH